jgi:hypothetical protein
MSENIQQPTEEEQKRLDDVLENSTDYVAIRGKRFGITWLHRGTIRKLTHVLHSCKNEDEVTARCASLIILNNWWKIKMFHWIYWRMLWKKYTSFNSSFVFIAIINSFNRFISCLLYHQVSPYQCGAEP